MHRAPPPPPPFNALRCTCCAQGLWRACPHPRACPQDLNTVRRTVGPPGLLKAVKATSLSLLRAASSGGASLSARPSDQCLLQYHLTTAQPTEHGAPEGAGHGAAGKERQLEARQEGRFGPSLGLASGALRTKAQGRPIRPVLAPLTHT